MKASDLGIGDKVRYVDGGETCIAKVLSKDDTKRIIHFIDTDDFEWDEEYDDIPEVVKSILSEDF